MVKRDVLIEKMIDILVLTSPFDRNDISQLSDDEIKSCFINVVDHISDIHVRCG